MHREPSRDVRVRPSLANTDLSVESCEGDSKDPLPGTFTTPT